MTFRLLGHRRTMGALVKPLNKLLGPLTWGAAGRGRSPAAAILVSLEFEDNRNQGIQWG